MDTLLKRIIGETALWKQMDHANILPFYGYQTRGEELILVSMWSEKRSLDMFLTFYPELTKLDKLELLHEAARGLEYLHSSHPSIVHGGIKPENVIVTDDLRAVLSDVGLSRVITNMGVRSGLTTGGQGVEFVAYQAKELYEDNSKPTTMSDVYAFGGVILTVG
ncbi:hypothetical protein FRC00_000866 [Tulasnella sp. 408]|nr:hypothetical protein FRC00_000866 [Tulasnella sp. 408]